MSRTPFMWAVISTVAGTYPLLLLDNLFHQPALYTLLGSIDATCSGVASSVCGRGVKYTSRHHRRGRIGQINHARCRIDRDVVRASLQTSDHVDDFSVLQYG